MTDTERAKLEENIRQLEQMKASGTMPPELADASIAALHEKLAAYVADIDGAIAQGQNAKAVGAGGVMVGGNVNGNIVVGDKNKIETKKGLTRKSKPLNHLAGLGM